MNTKEILIEARNIISDEKNWTQGAFARDENGDPVASHRPWAVCFCLIGAVHRAVMKAPNKRLNPLLLSNNALNALSLELRGQLFIYQFNDNSSHVEVLGLFDKAISNCQ